MKLILLALVLAILYQIIARALLLSKQDEGPRLRIEVEPPGGRKKSILRLGRKQPEKDITHRGRVVRD